MISLTAVPGGLALSGSSPRSASPAPSAPASAHAPRAGHCPATPAVQVSIPGDDSSAAQCSCSENSGPASRALQRRMRATRGSDAPHTKRQARAVALTRARAEPGTLEPVVKLAQVLQHSALCRSRVGALAGEPASARQCSAPAPAQHLAAAGNLSGDSTRTRGGTPVHAVPHDLPYRIAEQHGRGHVLKKRTE